MDDQNSTPTPDQPEPQSSQSNIHQLSESEINTQRQLTKTIHTIDLLNAQLGVTGALLVNHYHLQKQRETVTQPPQPPQQPPAHNHQYAPTGTQPYTTPPAQPLYSAPQTQYQPPFPSPQQTPNQLNNPLSPAQPNLTTNN